MDIFNTTISTGTMIIQYLSACADFSSDARSLKVRLEWDLRALAQAQRYFSTGQYEKECQHLEPEDLALLERTAEYLNYLVDKVYKNLHKIERGDWLRHTINMTTWIARRSQIQETAKEIHQWTERLNLRVLGLPKHVRTSIPTAYDERTSIQQSPIIRSGDRVHEFLALSLEAKLTQANEMLLRTPDDIITQIRAVRDISSLPFQYGDQQIIFCSREVSVKCLPDTSDFEVLVSQMGELAAVLSHLDPNMDIRLLKVNYYFYHPDSNQFLFAQTPPYHVDSMMTLDEFIKYDPFPGTEISLNERFKVAYKLAEAVFFLHTAGFCHKNITTHSVVILRRFKSHNSRLSNDIATDDAYLMGFDLIRGVGARTYKEGTRTRHNSGLRTSVWDFDIFQHPTRLQGEKSPRYIKAHDVYSLGVVLLALGFWQPLRDLVGQIDQSNPSSCSNLLYHVAPNMRQRTGGRYYRIVEWCLNMAGDHDVKNVEFMQMVLDPLEEIMNVMT